MTIKAVREYIYKRYAIKYSRSGATALLHRLGFVYKKPKIQPGKIDAMAQIKFLEKYEEIRKSGAPVYFVDGCHPQHNSQPNYGSILKGENKLLLSNTGRKRVNIHINLIERVWKYFKQSVLYNRYYSDFKSFKEACIRFLKANHRKKFATLLTEKFHLVHKNWSMLTPKFAMD